MACCYPDGGRLERRLLAQDAFSRVFERKGYRCRTATIGADGPSGARPLAVNAEAHRGKRMNAKIRDAQLQKMP
jgi:hypothetical protein